MEIKKQYDVNVLAEKLRKRVEISNGSDTRFVKIDLITAVEVLDVLEEIGRMEMEHEPFNIQKDMKHMLEVLPSSLGGKADAEENKKDEKAPGNMKAGCETKPRCYGKYTVDNAQEKGCTYCPNEVGCYLKSCRKKCFGTYENDSSICANCKYICECKKVTEERKMENSKCFGWYSCSSVECRFCKNVEDCRIETEKRIKSKEWDDE